jgi:hypothetical protein
MDGVTGSPEQPRQNPEKISPEQTEVHTGAEKLEAAAEAQAQRNEKKLDEATVKKVVEVFGEIVPDSGIDEASQEKLIETHAEVIREIGDKSELDQILVHTIAEQWDALGIRQEQATDELFKLYPTLNEKARNDIRAALKPMSASEKKEKDAITDKQADRMAKVTNAFGDEAKKSGSTIDKELQARIDDPNTPADKREELREAQGRVQGLLGRVSGFFAEGEKGKEWALKAGKGIYIGIIAFFLLVILELNLINKLAKKPPA